MNNNKKDIANEKTGIFSGATVNLIGEVFAKISVLVTTLIITRFFSPKEAGLFLWGFTFIGIISFICMLGIRMGIVRFVAMQGRHDRNQIRSMVITASLIVLIVCVITSAVFSLNFDYFVNHLLKKEAFLHFGIWFVWSLPFEALRRILLGGLEGLKMMRYTMLVEGIILQTMRLAFVLLFSFVFGFGIEGAAAGFFVASVLSFGIALFFVNKHIKLFNKEKIEFNYASLLKFSLPMLPASFLFNASIQLGVIMLGFLGTEASIAVFSVCVRLCNSAEVLMRAFNQILNPYFANSSLKDDYQDLKSVFYFSAKWTCLGTIPVYLSLMIAPEFFLSIFFIEYETAVLCLVILACTHMISSVSNLSSSLIVMSGHSNLSLLNNIVFFICYFLLSILLIPEYNVNGASISHMASFFLLAFLRAFEVKKLFKIQTYNLYFIKMLIISLACAMPFTVIDYFGIYDFQSRIFPLILFLMILLISVWYLYLSKTDKLFVRSILSRDRIK